jgi:hypothetical protein
MIYKPVVAPQKSKILIASLLLERDLTQIYFNWSLPPQTSLAVDAFVRGPEQVGQKGNMT